MIKVNIIHNEDGSLTYDASEPSDDNLYALPVEYLYTDKPMNAQVQLVNQGLVYIRRDVAANCDVYKRTAGIQSPVVPTPKLVFSELAPEVDGSMKEALLKKIEESLIKLDASRHDLVSMQNWVNSW